LQFCGLAVLLLPQNGTMEKRKPQEFLVLLKGRGCCLIEPAIIGGKQDNNSKALPTQTKVSLTCVRSKGDVRLMKPVMGAVRQGKPKAKARHLPKPPPNPPTFSFGVHHQEYFHPFLLEKLSQTLRRAFLRPTASNLTQAMPPVAKQGRP